MASHTDILKQRGLLAVATRAGWTPHAVGTSDGWRYPTYTEDGEPCEASRWKACNSADRFKYLWIPKDAQRPTYYLLPGTVAAIEEWGSVVHLVAGEIDLLTMHAAGWPNVLSWYGEQNVPKTLATDLKRMGVKRAVYYPDCDTPGMKAARAVWDTLRDSEIEIRFRKLDGEDESGYDLNDVWQAVQFHPQTFQERLAACPVLTFEDDAPRQSTLHERLSAPSGANDWRNEWIDTIIDALGAPDTREGGVDRWHCPLPSHPDKHPSFRVSKDQNPDFPWPMCSCNIQREDDAWEQVASALSVESWDAFKERKRADTNPPTANRGISTQQPPENAPTNAHERAHEAERVLRVVTSDQAIARVRSLATGETVTDTLPILAPYKPLHQFGGLLKLWEPRKIILLVGPSGMGKTAWMETCQDGHRMRGEDFLLWGPEWSPTEYLMRAVCAWGGPGVTAQREDHLWRKEESLNIPREKRHGKALRPNERQRVLDALDKLSSWPGQGHYIDEVPHKLSDLEATVGVTVNRLRDQGRNVVAFYLDYVQKLPKRGDAWDTVERMIGYVWEFCQAYDLIGVVASQVRKADGLKVREGKMLNETSAESVSDKYVNAFLTLNPVFTDDGGRLEEGYMRVLKNSLAPAPAKLRVKTALYRHRWLDDIVGDLEADTFDKGTNHEEPEAPAPVDLAGLF